MGIFDYAGAIHIHTKHSDGGGDVDYITKAAKKAGLSWIIITDHNNFDVKEGIYNGVCVIKGEEISPQEANHYLAFGIESLILPDCPVEEYVRKVKAQGGFGFAAHPDESPNRRNSNAPLRWLDKDIPVDGLEIWNWFSDWADGFDSSNIFTVAYSYLFRNKLISGAKPETLAWWDKLNNENSKITPAIGGLDVHALKVRKYLIPVTIFPYEFAFGTIVNLLKLNQPLEKDFLVQKKKILNALQSGNNTILGNWKFFRKNIPLCRIKTSNDKSYFSGDIAELDDATFFEISLPVPGIIKIIKNGQVIYKATARDLCFKLQEAGKYRAEVKINNNTRIYTNPIIVR